MNNKIDDLLKPIQLKKKYSIVIEKILDLIKQGYFKAGDKLPPERIMADKLGVSRPSVREGYCALEMTGILESRAGSGTYVKSVDINATAEKKLDEISTTEESPYEAIEIRKILEPEIAALACTKASLDDIKKVESILENMKDQIKQKGSYDLQTDAQFHLTLAEIADNQLLYKIIENIINIMYESLWVEIRERIVKNPGHKERDIKYHENIVSLIKENKPREMRSLVKEHFEFVRRELI
ncbi:MAG: FadR family transcriptional regulator [Actinobacteria bacterium]|nr:FadR family transcriptional regulator [Actinomycetota bacterium]